MRLDKIISDALLLTRKGAKQLIKAGRVRFNSSVIFDPAKNFSEDELSCLSVDEKSLDAGRFYYYLMNKPEGYITAMKSSYADCVADILPENFVCRKIQPVGRLDKNTSGLLIFTNDGELLHRLISPKYKVPRLYYVAVHPEGPPFEAGDADSVASGLELDGNEFSLPGKLEVLSDFEARITLYEGKYHEVKRIMQALGKELIKLHREAYGPLELKGEAPGSIRKISAKEEDLLKASVNMK